jgi:Flp pilus assembly protein TadG
MRVSRRRSRRGAALIEFALIAFLLLLVMFAGIELDRMLFVYSNLADSAKAGVRYAITHGSHRTGTGTDGPSGPSDNPTQVVTTVKNYASLMMNPASLTVTVTYPDAANTIGSHVKILVQYAYDPMTLLPLSVTLSATSQGIISF